MSPSIILHVGPHKTGSTAIQQTLVANRGALGERRIAYPTAGIADYGHHELVNHSRGWPNKHDQAAFTEQLRAASVAVVSSENIVHLNDASLETLKTALGSGEIKVVYYLRRLIDLWYSHWQELIKHGHHISFLEYLAYASFILPNVNNVAIDQAEQLKTLARVFGKESLHIVGYDYLRERNIDFTENFVSAFLGVPGDSLTIKTQSVNASKPGWITELVRALNILHMQETGRRPTAQLRIRILNDLARKAIGFSEEFSQVVKRFTRPITLNSDEFVVKSLQQRVVDAFGDRIVGDAAGVIECYVRPAKRVMQNFNFPLIGYESLRAQMRAYYAELPPESRASVGK